MGRCDRLLRRAAEKRFLQCAVGPGVAEKWVQPAISGRILARLGDDSGAEMVAVPSFSGFGSGACRSQGGRRQAFVLHMYYGMAGIGFLVAMGTACDSCVDSVAVSAHDGLKVTLRAVTDEEFVPGLL